MTSKTFLCVHLQKYLVRCVYLSSVSFNLTTADWENFIFSSSLQIECVRTLFFESLLSFQTLFLLSWGLFLWRNVTHSGRGCFFELSLHLSAKRFGNIFSVQDISISLYLIQTLVSSPHKIKPQADLTTLADLLPLSIFWARVKDFHLTIPIWAVWALVAVSWSSQQKIVEKNCARLR